MIACVWRSFQLRSSVRCVASLLVHSLQVLPLWAVLLLMLPLFVAGITFIVVRRAHPAVRCSSCL